MLRDMMMGKDDDDDDQMASGGDHQKMQIIKDLMDELMGNMEPSKDDFDLRLGKPKVDVFSMKMDGQDGDDDSMPTDGDMPAMDGSFDSPEDKLKARLMRLQG